MSLAVVVVAAGSGTRAAAMVGGVATNKVLVPLAGRPVLAWSLATLLRLPGLVRVVVVVRDGEQRAVADALAPEVDGLPVEGPTPEVGVVAGGATRHDSEWAALRVLAADVETGRVGVVAVHDAARPLAPYQVWERVLGAAGTGVGAIPVVAAPPLLRTDPGAPEPVVRGLGAVQTPQAFPADALLAAYRRAEADGFRGTDTAACLAAYGDLPVLAVAGSPLNLKVTWPGDLALAEGLLAGQGLEQPHVVGPADPHRG